MSIEETGCEQIVLEYSYGTSVAAEEQSPERESLHSRAIKSLENFLELEVPRVQVIESFKVPEYAAGDYIHCAEDGKPLIRVKPQYFNKDAEEMLKTILVHEYAHHAFYLYFREKLSEISSEYSGNDVDEAFAFWVQNQITENPLKDSISFRECYAGYADRIIAFYKELNRISGKKGKQFVLDNIADIIINTAPYVYEKDRKFAAAAKMFERINDIDRAIENYCLAGLEINALEILIKNPEALDKFKELLKTTTSTIRDSLSKNDFNSRQSLSKLEGLFKTMKNLRFKPDFPERLWTEFLEFSVQAYRPIGRDLSMYLELRSISILASYCESQNRLEEAAFFYERAKDYSKAAEINELLGNFEDAASLYCIAMKWHERVRIMEKAGKENLALIEYMRLDDMDSIVRILKNKNKSEQREMYRDLIYEAHIISQDGFIIKTGEALGLLKTAAATYSILGDKKYRQEALDRMKIAA